MELNSVFYLQEIRSLKLGLFACKGSFSKNRQAKGNGFNKANFLPVDSQNVVLQHQKVT